MIRTPRDRARAPKSSLWTLIAPPTTWALHFLFCYVYAAIYCAKGGRLEVIGHVRAAIALATVVAILVILLCGYVAWTQSRIEGDSPPHQQGADEDRLRFLAVATLLLAGLSFIAIVFTTLPAFIFGDCA
jgi:hypothetical protein